MEEYTGCSDGVHDGHWVCSCSKLYEKIEMQNRRVFKTTSTTMVVLFTKVPKLRWVLGKLTGAALGE
jgi:hypothetical protein